MTIADKIRAAGKIIAALPVIAALAFAVLSQNAEAQQSGQKTKTERLLGEALNEFAFDENGWTHLHWAAVADDPESIRRLMEMGAAPSPRAKNDSDFSDEGKSRLQVLGIQKIHHRNKGGTPLHTAVKFDKIVAASVLIASGAKINAKDDDGDTPLHMIFPPSLEIARLLVENGADVNAKDKEGWTALHDLGHSDLLSDRGYDNALRVVRFLLKNGADVNAKTEGDHTPWDMAAIYDDARMQSLLRQYGGRCNQFC